MRRKTALQKRWEDMDEEKILKNEELYKEYLEHSSDYEDNDIQKEESDKIRKRYAILLGEQEDDNDELKEGEMMMTFTAEEAEVEKKEKKEKKSKKQQEKEKAELELLMMEDINEHESVKRDTSLGNDEENKAIKLSRKERRKQGKKKSKLEKADKDFKIDVEDERFKKIIESNEYEIDPTNPEYVPTRGMKELLKYKHKAFAEKRKNMKK